MRKKVINIKAFTGLIFQKFAYEPYSYFHGRNMITSQYISFFIYALVLSLVRLLDVYLSSHVHYPKENIIKVITFSLG